MRIRGYGTYTVLYAVARRRYRGRLVIFSAASCHEKDTGSFIGRDLLTPSFSRERDGDRDLEGERGEGPEGNFSFHFLHKRIQYVLVSRI